MNWRSWYWVRWIYIKVLGRIWFDYCGPHVKVDDRKLTYSSPVDDRFSVFADEISEMVAERLGCQVDRVMAAKLDYSTDPEAYHTITFRIPQDRWDAIQLMAAQRRQHLVPMAT